MSEGEDIWMEIVRIHESDGAKPLNQIDGLWRRELADGWSIVVNGHTVPFEDAETHFEVAPFNAIAVRGGMPYLYFGPPGSSGVALGHGSEDAFWAALKST